MSLEPLPLLSQNWPLNQINLMMFAVAMESLGIQQQLHVAMEYLAQTSVVQRIQVKICLPSCLYHCKASRVCHRDL